MCAQPADRRKASDGGTVRLSAVPTAGDLETIGRYRILSELGRGAMARVYLALDPNIDRRIALKVLEPGFGRTPLEQDELRTRFLLEARAAGRLRHPAAVAIYDADHDEPSGYSFIAMEWVDGQSLAELLRQEQVLSVEQALDIVTQVAGALDAAHRQGLIHRDVKPANILLGRHGEAKLSDFGIAKAESLELTSTGQVLGTPFYMSPEQIRDEELDGRSDLFSLAVVLYQCLTGRLPFQAESLPALTHKILHADPVAVSAINSEVPADLAKSLDRALAKQPDERFQTGAALVEALAGGAESPPPTVALTEPAVHAQPEAPVAPDPPNRDGTSQGRRRGLLLPILLLAIALTAVWFADTLSPPPSPQVGMATESETTGSPSEASRPAPPSVAEPVPESSSSRNQPTGQATLQISYTNRLKRATLMVWVDGEPVLTRSLQAPRGLLKRAVGRTTLESVPVSSGHHDIKVTVRGANGKIEASNRAGSLFDAGQTRRLRVELIPPSYLKLAWK